MGLRTCSKRSQHRCKGRKREGVLSFFSFLFSGYSLRCSTTSFLPTSFLRLLLLEPLINTSLCVVAQKAGGLSSVPSSPLYEEGFIVVGRRGGGRLISVGSHSPVSLSLSLSDAGPPALLLLCWAFLLSKSPPLPFLFF